MYLSSKWPSHTSAITAQLYLSYNCPAVPQLSLTQLYFSYNWPSFTSTITDPEVF